MERNDWIRVVRATAGKNPIPAGLTGQVFWTGTDGYGNARLGVDLNGEGARIFVNAAKCQKLAPLPRFETCGGCEACDGEGGHRVELLDNGMRAICPTCGTRRCPDGCCCAC